MKYDSRGREEVTLELGFPCLFGKSSNDFKSRKINEEIDFTITSKIKLKVNREDHMPRFWRMTWAWIGPYPTKKSRVESKPDNYYWL